MPSTKRRAHDELVSPPPKRHKPTSPSFQWHLAPISISPTSSRTLSAQQSSPSSPHQSVLTPPSISVSASLVDHEAEEELYDLLCRIQDGIEYEQTQRNNGVAIKQYTCFEVATTSSPALTLLRRHATRIWASDTLEVYELGIPRPGWVTEGMLPGLHDPQWWEGKSLAEIKAGPYAEERDIKRATTTLKGLQTKRSKKKVPTAREKEIDWKLREGFRRQEQGLRMWDEESSGSDGESIRGKPNLSNNSNNESDNSESDGSEDQMLVKWGIRRVAAKAPRSRAQLLESDSENEMPVRRVVSCMAAKAPRRRVRPVIHDSESESESEADIPILRDPRYLQFKR